ncbi:proline--tRNA ligase [Pseudofulvibacter geojedonensis]|uniref:Proline--tRNA ligase n=1 Tax=Pseudofulvibacter geojedonensis TaxID=1123758 RepID=A0ABW3I189_9FLAO
MSKKLPKRSEDFSLWYNELVKNAGLAENSGVRGCMVIKPYGFAIWELMKDQLDKMFKETGHQNAYFPIFVPKSLFEAEEKNAEGFAKECAVVTHYRLKNDPNDASKLIVDPDAKLEEELIVRPTSEAIIWNTYKGWIQSYRDLPILINQWANVVRWEMRTRLFLRTAEFLWQEGHTAHATKDEAIAEAKLMHNVYAKFAEEWMAMPVVKGYKSDSERFAGADDTFTIEALMQDGKALQAGTSHFLGQNFAKAFDVKYETSEGGKEYVWATSWGVSTRLMGALIMSHSDDEGLVLPPKLAPYQVVIVPFLNKKKQEQNEVLLAKANEIKDELAQFGIRVQIDTDETKRPGFKFAEYELKGYPVRLVVGPRDLENNQVEIARRDTKEKSLQSLDGIGQYVNDLLVEMQENIFSKALNYRNNHITEVNTFDEFKDAIENKGGFVSAHWDGTEATEDEIKNLTKATIRCIPLDAKEEAGTCILTGAPSNKRVLFAKAY